MLLWSLVAFAAPCDSPAGKAEVVAAMVLAEKALGNGDAEASRLALEAAQGHVACLVEPLGPADVSRFFQIRALVARARGDEASAALDLQAAVEADRDAKIALVGADAEREAEWAALLVADPVPRMAVPAPVEGVIHVDGRPDLTRPARRPWVFQRVGEKGVVLSSAVVEKGAVAPPYEEAAAMADAEAPAAVVAPEPVKPAKPERIRSRSVVGRPARTSRGLAVAGLVAGVAAAPAFAIAAGTKSRYRDTPIDEDASGLVVTNRAAGLVGITAVATGAGLVGGAVVVGRW